MKRILCHFAQRNPHSAGPIAKHVSHCRECQEFYQQIPPLESRLITNPGEPDLDLCSRIMASISSEQSVISPPPKSKWISSPIALAIAAALVISLIGILTVTNFNKPPQVTDIPPQPAADSVNAPTHSAPVMNIAYALKQQELLQRDALKLGAHLRENLILFRADD